MKDGEGSGWRRRETWDDTLPDVSIFFYLKYRF